MPLQTMICTTECMGGLLYMLYRFDLVVVVKPSLNFSFGWQTNGTYRGRSTPKEDYKEEYSLFFIGDLSISIFTFG